MTSELPSRAEVLAKLTMAERWALEDPIDPNEITLRRTGDRQCPTCREDVYWTPGHTTWICIRCSLRAGGG